MLSGSPRVLDYWAFMLQGKNFTEKSDLASDAKVESIHDGNEVDTWRAYLRGETDSPEKAELIGAPALGTYAPDLFCLSAAVMKVSGCYTFYGTRRFSTKRALSTVWTELVECVLAEPQVRIASHHHTKAFHSLLFECFFLADRACQGWGRGQIMKYGVGEWIGEELLRPTTSGSTLCSGRIRPEFARVLPKLQGCRPGNTLRSLSRNLSFIDGDEVHTTWITAPSKAEGDQYRVLFVPWPDFITDQQIKGSLDPESDGKVGHFVYEPVNSSGGIVERVINLVEEVNSKLDQVDLVLLPELALGRNDYLLLREYLVRKQISLIAGVGGVSREGANENRVVVDIPLGGNFVLHLRQRKHHPWIIDRTSIKTYGLGSRLQSGVIYWEDIPIGERYVNFLPLHRSLIANVLICEDLARSEPVGKIIQSVGPNFVLALLMDGPQLDFRWSSRPAEVLRDDPGCSVLSVTCIGMCERSKHPVGSSSFSRVVALWTDPVGEKAIPIELAKDAKGIVLTLNFEKRTIHKQNGEAVEVCNPVLSGIDSITGAKSSYEDVMHSLGRDVRELTSNETSILCNIARLGVGLCKGGSPDEFRSRYGAITGRLRDDALKIAQLIVQKSFSHGEVESSRDQKSSHLIAADRFLKWASSLSVDSPPK